MKILYQSEITGKTYETKEALVEAEAAVSAVKRAEEEKKKARAEAAKKVEEKLAIANAAIKDANDALAAFCKEFGSFKTTFKGDNLKNPFSILFDTFWNL